MNNYLSEEKKEVTKVNISGSVTSPSANIAEIETEQEVPPFKPQIMKSNSQALNAGGYECKTTTKKSPKGVDLEQMLALKEAMNAVNITAKMPSSTTNQSSSDMKLRIHNSLNLGATSGKKNSANLFSNRGGASSYGALGALGHSSGVGHGPIKINQKLAVHTTTNQSTAHKVKQSDTGSSQKMKISKTTRTSLNNSSVRQNLNATFYQQKLAEQREAQKQ